ncbi:hypothetical protein, partial [Lacticaseibacillus hegangensis]
MDFYFTDRDYNVLGVAGINYGHFRIAGELETQSTTVATTLFTGTLYYENRYAEQAIAMCADTNYLLLDYSPRYLGHEIASGRSESNVWSVA